MNRTDQKILVAIYLRLSKEDGDLSTSSKEESNSISNQRKLIQNYLMQHPEMTFVQEYCDDGYTGTNFDRPSFIEMLEAIKAKKINCVIVKDLSRFGRDYIETGYYQEKLFPQLGVRFIALTDGYDSASQQSAGTDIVLPFKNLINDSYSRDISIKIRSNLQIKRQNGEFVGSRVVYGYKRSDTNKNQLVVDRTVAPIIQDIFRWKIDGLSPNQIADRLNCQGVLSPAEYKRSCGVKFQTKFQRHAVAEWSAVAIYRILKNEMYTGCLVQGKTTSPNYKVKKRRAKAPSEWCRTENAHEPIITPDQFKLVQDLLGEDTRRPEGKVAVHPLAGKIFCADCGGTMFRKEMTSGRKQYVYFLCSTHKKDKKLCATHQIREQEVHDVVLSVIQAHVAIALNLETAMERIDLSSWEHRELAKLEQAISDKVKNITENEIMKNGLLTDFKNGLITQHEYQLFSAEFDKQIQEARGAMKHLEEEKEHIAEGFSEQQQWLHKFQECRQITVLDRRTVAQFVDRVEIGLNHHVSVRLRNDDLFHSAITLVKEMNGSALPQESDSVEQEVG